MILDPNTASAIDEELESLPTQIGERTGGMLRSLLKRHGFESGRLVHPVNQPIALLPQWVSQSPVLTRKEITDETVLDLTLATVIGYLYVRVQDDLIDEDLGDCAPVMLLGDALLSRHVRLLAQQAGGSRRFWQFFEQTAWAYGNAMLLEHELHEPGAQYGKAEFEEVLRRSEPLVLPSVVILDRCDSWDVLAPLQDFVHLITRSGQLVDDLRDAAHDHDAGNYTWVVRELGGLNGKGEMLTSIVMGGFDRVMGLADGDLKDAAAIAADLELGAAVPWLEQRRSAIRAMRDQFYKELGIEISTAPGRSAET